MNELSKWQIVSFISRGIAQGLGVIQGFIIARILLPSEFGVEQLALALGATFGIYQHLGLASGSTREISAAKNDDEVFKIFVTSCIIRYIVTIPLAAIMYFSATTLAVDTYQQPTMVKPIQLFSVVLLLQGVQSILNSVISGTKRFKRLFIYQAAIAVVSVVIYVPAVYFYRVNGYFYALILFNLISSIILWIIAFKPLKTKMPLPSRKDFNKLFKELLSISLAIYVVKILYTYWERSGTLLLGREVSIEMVAVFSFALLYTKKLMAFSDSVTDVNLPVLSEKYVHDMEAFKTLFKENFNKLYAIVIFIGACAAYWSREITHLFMGGGKYDASLSLILPLMFAFIFYSYINIIKSSVIIPAKMVKEMMLSFVFLLGGTVAVFYACVHVFKVEPLMSMAIGMTTGALISLLSLHFFSKFKLNLSIFTHDHVLLVIHGFLIAYMGYLENFILKGILFAILITLYIWGVFITKFYTKKDFAFSMNRFTRLKGRVK